MEGQTTQKKSFNKSIISPSNNKKESFDIFSNADNTLTQLHNTDRIGRSSRTTEPDRTKNTFNRQTNTEKTNRKDGLRQIARQYEIKTSMAERLQELQDYEIVIVCDDSGSMLTTVDNSQLTRWDELRKIVKIVLDIGVIFDSNGVDIYFLNGGTFKNVKDPKQVDEAFKVRPRGYTPLVPVLREIFKLPPSRHGHDKKLLVFVATDGAPTDEDGNETIEEFKNLMVNERRAETTHVAFLLCTDDEECVDYLSEWDKEMVNVDVTDDFKTEKKKIRQYRGDRYSFSYGDYVVKALVGAIQPEIDRLNEPT